MPPLLAVSRLFDPTPRECRKGRDIGGLMRTAEPGGGGIGGTRQVWFARPDEVSSAVNTLADPAESSIASPERCRSAADPGLSAPRYRA
ncbi:hypothetical protein GCM10009642_08020 [Nocardiopsis metallicus]